VFRSKLFEALRGYDRATFFSDLAAGVTVGARTSSESGSIELFS